MDIGIVGSGPAGYTAALNAKDDNVVIFEKDLIGGVCLNKGCIPTKTMLHTAEIINTIKKSDCYGICVNDFSLDFEKVLENRYSVVEKLRNGLERSLKNANVKIVNAKAKIIDKNTIDAEGQIYKFDKIICATGSSPRKTTDYDGEFVLTSDDVFNLKTLPKKVVIVGSGAIGIEFTRIFSAFGVEVVLVEFAEHLLPNADIDISKRVERLFKDIKFYTKTSVEKIDKSNKLIILSNGEEITADMVILAIGREPNKVEKIDGVTYIGDVAGEIQLAHFASKQALEEVCKIPFEKTLVPSVVYGTPEIAWVGKREQDLQNFEKKLIPISALAKSQCDNSTDGVMKILIQNKKIVGAHIMSNEASSLIQQLVIAMQFDISPDDLKSVCFAHPTYSEGILQCL